MYIINNSKFYLYLFAIRDFLNVFYQERNYIFKIFSKCVSPKENIFKILI